MKPRFVDEHFNLGASLQTLGQWAEVIPAYSQALALRPDYVEALTNVGTCCVEQGRMDDAIAQFEQALSTCSTRFAAVAHIFRPRHDGQKPRPLHENAT